jgi:hypothetical protein
MGLIPTTVVFLARATRIAGAICILVWLIGSGIIFMSNPELAAGANPALIGTLEPTAWLYLFPGLILLLTGFLVKTGRLWPAPIILLISILSLFKLVLLLLPMRGPIFGAPLSLELPARIACALLSVPCVFAWEDLAEMNRTRARRPKPSRLATSETFAGFPSPVVPPLPPPPTTRIRRPPIRPDDPPAARTPWS